MIDTGQSINTQFPTTSGNFSQFKKQIADILATSIEPGQRGTAFVIGELDEHGQAHGRAGIATKIGDNWRIVTDVSADQGKHVTGRVIVAGSWK